MATGQGRSRSAQRKDWGIASLGPLVAIIVATAFILAGCSSPEARRTSASPSVTVAPSETLATTAPTAPPLCKSTVSGLIAHLATGSVVSLNVTGQCDASVASFELGILTHRLPSAGQAATTGLVLCDKVKQPVTPGTKALAHLDCTFNDVGTFTVEPTLNASKNGHDFLSAGPALLTVVRPAVARSTVVPSIDLWDMPAGIPKNGTFNATLRLDWSSVDWHKQNGTSYTVGLDASSEPRQFPPTSATPPGCGTPKYNFVTPTYVAPPPSPPPTTTPHPTNTNFPTPTDPPTPTTYHPPSGPAEPSPSVLPAKKDNTTGPTYHPVVYLPFHCTAPVPVAYLRPYVTLKGTRQENVWGEEIRVNA